MNWKLKKPKNEPLNAKTNLIYFIQYLGITIFLIITYYIPRMKDVMGDYIYTIAVAFGIVIFLNYLADYAYRKKEEKKLVK